ncbi:hypothetical protein Bca4012_073594 [Brassica carinata]|uniref:Uncharacterized protein n=1 Tax=Brassica carinata TaxID=52824 RepID=A0A8X7QJ79_BRACI|nr:hypothetical protein Bca52824_065895 [Brassica carinata]
MDSDEVDSIQLQTLQPYHPGKILSIKEAFVTLTIYLEPKVHYLTEKSIEVLSISKYSEHIQPHTRPNYDHSETTLGESTSCLRAIYQKQFSNFTMLKTKAQEMLKNNEITKPVAKMDLAMVGATTLIGSPLIFIIKLLSAVSNQIVLRGRRNTAINKNQSLDIDEANTAQLLKACGTTPGSPVKLRKASENLETPQHGKQFTSSQFDSWISSYSDAVFHLDEKTPEAYGEEVSEQTPSSNGKEKVSAV